MRILMTTEAVGGVWPYTLDLLQATRRCDVEFVLACIGQPPSQQQKAAAAKFGATLVVGEFQSEWAQDPWSDMPAARDWLLGLERQFQPDVVHLNGYCHATLAWKSRRLVVAHKCLPAWWRTVRGQDPPACYERYNREVAAGLQAADMAVAPTRAMLSELTEHYGRPRRTQIIPHARGQATALDCPKEPLVMSAGDLWDEALEVQALDQAAKQIEWPVYIAGEDRHPLGHALRHDHTVCLGQLCDPGLRHWIGRASIFALPVRFEAFGRSALLAAQSRCALVLGDIPSLREIWDDAALYVPPADSSALTKAIEAIIRDNALRTEMAGRAAARAKAYTSSGLARRYMRAYRSLACVKPPTLPLGAIRMEAQGVETPG